MVGNKLDLEADRVVDTEEVIAFAKENGLLFSESSAKSGEKVVDIFTDIGKNMFNFKAKKLPLEQLSNPQGSQGNISVGDDITEKSNQCAC